MTVVAVLLVAASELFYRLGILLALLGALALLAVPAWRLPLLMTRGKGGVRPSPRRYLPRLVLTGVVLAVVMGHLAWSSVLRVPAVVRYEDREVIRVKTSGFVDAIHVERGQAVKAGDLLVRLRNPELDADLATLASRVGEAEIRARRLLLDGDLAAYQAQQQASTALRRQFQELELRRRELEVAAPSTGRLVARRLPDLLGTYVEVGSELMSLVNEGRKGLRLSVSAADLSSLSLSPGDRIAVTFSGHGSRVFQTEYKQIAPRATTRVEMPMLAASSGGHLPVRPRASDDTGSVTSDTAGFEYLEPRVILDTILDEEASEALQAGEVGVARLSTTPRSLGEHALGIARDWFDHLMDRRGQPL